MCLFVQVFAPMRGKSGLFWEAYPSDLLFAPNYEKGLNTQCFFKWPRFGELYNQLLEFPYSNRKSQTYTAGLYSCSYHWLSWDRKWAHCSLCEQKSRRWPSLPLPRTNLGSCVLFHMYKNKIFFWAWMSISEGLLHKMHLQYIQTMECSWYWRC